MSTQLSLEIAATILGVIATILNFIVALVVLLLIRKETLFLGLTFILLTISFDIITPVVGIIQEIISNKTNENVLLLVYPCQVFGFFHTFIPVGSSTGVAFLTLERYLTITEKKLPKWLLWLICIIILLIAFIFAILASVNTQFEFTAGRMMCMPLPNQFLGGVYYYILLISLIINSLIIGVGYCGIIKTMKEKHFLPSYKLSTINNQNDVCSKLKLIDNSEENEEKEIKDKGKVPQRVLFKSIIFVICYLVCILPAIVILIYQVIMTSIDNQFELQYALSVMLYASFCSFSIANHILLLLLHNRVYARLSNIMSSLRC